MAKAGVIPAATMLEVAVGAALLVALLGLAIGPDGGALAFFFLALALPGSAYLFLHLDRPLAVTLLAGVAFLLVDFTPLAVYRHLLLGDMVLLLSFVVLSFQTRRWRYRIPTIFAVLLIPYLLALLVSLVVAPDPSRGIFTWAHYAFATLVLLPSAFGLFSARPDLGPLFMRLVVLSAFLQATAISVDIAQGLDWTTGRRIFGAFGNHMVWLFCAATAAAFAWIVDGNWRERCAGIVVLPMLLFATGVLRARMLWVALLVAVAVIVFLRLRSRILGAVLVAATCVTLIAVYRYELFPDAIQRRLEQTTSVSRELDLQWRIRVVEIMWRPFSEQPLLGVGLNHSELHIPLALVQGSVDAVHNIVLNAMVEGGIVAGLAMLLLPVACLRSWGGSAAWRPRARRTRTSDWAVASLLGVFAGAQFTPAIYEHVFYLLLALLAAERDALAPGVEGAAQLVATREAP